MKTKKIILFAFATKDLIRSAERLKKQAIKLDIYDEIKILNEDFAIFILFLFIYYLPSRFARL